MMQDGYPFKQMNPRVWKNLDEIYAGSDHEWGQDIYRICTQWLIKMGVVGGRGWWWWWWWWW
jgi:hypothetical protein